MIAIECDDAQALHILSRPEAINVRLRRTLSFALESGGVTFYQSRASVLVSKATAASFSQTVENLNAASWWRSPYEEAHPNENTRVFEGEIQLPASLAPAGELPLYKFFVSRPTYFSRETPV